MDKLSKVFSSFGLLSLQLFCSLGDQDILNALIKEHPDIIYKLPCYWNTQMSSFSTSSACYSKFKAKVSLRFGGNSTKSGHKNC